jgi:alanyl-tRNA synthetase
LIKDFVITEESGIAKGIRRIVAVTGHEALEANRVLADIITRLDLLDKKGGKEKDAGLKTLTVVSKRVETRYCQILTLIVGAQSGRHFNYS